MKRTILTVALLLGVGMAGAQETTRFFAAAASAEGSNDTFWLTDARVFNPSSEQAISVFVAFLRANSDNSGAAEVEITIEPRQAVALDDMVGTVFSRSGAGGVRLRSEMPFVATSRTYNIGNGVSGTFGQFIPGLDPDEALQQGILLSVVNDPAADGFRSNLGFVNPSGEDLTVMYKVYDAGTAEMVGEGEKQLPPLAFSQINDVFNAIGEAATVVRNASVEFMATSPVFVYASVVDNTSGDAIFVLPSADSGTPTASNDPPEGTIVSPANDFSVMVGEAVAFEATVSDPDGDEVTGMDWDFGDGITASGLQVNHTYSEAGVYQATFTATDDGGLSDPSPDSRTITVVEAAASFTQVQAQVFSASCAFSGCHSGGSAASGLDLSEGNSHANIVGVASVQQPSVNRIEPFSPEDSYLWLKVIDDSSISGGRMPRGAAPLSQEILDLLRSWIEGGAEND